MTARPLTPLIVLLAIAAAHGCERKAATAEPEPVVPANGQGVYLDDEGVPRTLLRPRGVISYGGEARGALPDSQILIGYEFVGSAEDVAEITLALDAPGIVALYGPRTSTGLWGQALLTTERARALTARTPPLPASGHYLIFLTSTAPAPGAAYTLSLLCAEGPCRADPCPDTPPCDLFCEQGYTVDAAGCRACACADADARCDEAGAGCPLGESCEDGRCQPAPACEAECPSTVSLVCGADGQTYRNRCTAECAEVEVASTGACTDRRCGPEAACPEDLVCNDEGRCVEPPCSCEPEQRPVCSTEGHTWANACLMACRGESLEYEGACVRRRCDPYSNVQGQCPSGTQCLPAITLPENLARCVSDPRSPSCIYECRATPEVQVCSDHDDCPSGAVCYMAPEARVGICAQACRTEEARAAACRGILVCAEVPLRGVEEGVGACLLPCASVGETATCFDPQVCTPDLGGRPFCQSCPCDPEAGSPVCADGVTYINACFAQCAGHAREDLTAGECSGAPPAFCPDCPADPSPVCADDRRLYNTACEALCEGATPSGDASCFDVDPPQIACRRDEDCFTTGCRDLLCAAERSDLCPQISPEYQCLATQGQCGCVDNVCRFARTPRADRCVARSRR